MSAMQEQGRQEIDQRGYLAGEIIAQGKTKIIRATHWGTVVEIESKDDITAGDGAKKDPIPDKGKLATTTTANVFTLLNKHGIPTHYLEQESETSFLAKRAAMIPLEVVARRVATGSYLQRHPRTKEGTIFDELPIEFFYKDDAAHDPMVVPSQKGWRMFHPKRTERRGQMKEETKPPGWLGITMYDVREMAQITAEVFEILENAWGNLGVSLIDMKIEFGRDQDGKLMVADVIDNDSWRIWEGGDKAQMLDKQVYRNIPKATKMDLERIKKNYERVALMTEQFLTTA